MSNNELDQFSFYLESLSIKTNNDILVLSSHYYYNLDEISHVNAIVHTKELNHIADLHRLMSNMMKGLSNGTKFIGCFIDNKLRYKGKIGYWLLHLAESEINQYLTRKKMVNLFEKYGLQIEDITEVNGVTYFCVKKH